MKANFNLNNEPVPTPQEPTPVPNPTTQPIEDMPERPIKK